MSTSRRPRATALVEWEYQGTRGVLVHADHKQFWLLPGGGLNENHKTGQSEPALVAAVRELYEETGLGATAVSFLFSHPGSYNEHEVFLVRARGDLHIVDPNEAPAFGLCHGDFTVTPILAARDFPTSRVRLMNSTRQIIERYHSLRADRPALFHAFTTLDQLDGSDPTGTPDRARPEVTSSHTGRERVRIISQDKMVVAQVGAARLELVRGDIVRQDVDAVVNAANAQLANGAGVSGALHTAAGAQQLEDACRALKGCPTGEARITPGFNLAARHIIHAVGPIYRQHTHEHAEQLLASAYRTSLERASDHQLRSIAFPSLSTGIYGFPIEQAAPIALRTVISYLAEHSEIELVRFVLRDDTRPTFEQELRRLASV